MARPCTVQSKLHWGAASVLFWPRGPAAQAVKSSVATIQEGVARGGGANPQTFMCSAHTAVAEFLLLRGQLGQVASLHSWPRDLSTTLLLSGRSGSASRDYGPALLLLLLCARGSATSADATCVSRQAPPLAAEIAADVCGSSSSSGASRASPHALHLAARHCFADAVP